MLPPGYTAVHNSCLPWTVLFNLFCFVCLFVPCIFCVFLCIFLLLLFFFFSSLVFLLYFFYCIHHYN